MNSIFDYLRTLKFDDDIKLISLLIGVIGIFFALRNQYLTRVTHAERSTFEMIDKLYNLCHTIEKTLLDDWRLSHMFCMGKDEYLKRRFDIEKSMESDSEKTKYKYKEFHYTIHLLLIYEQVYYQLKCTKKSMKERRKFLNDILSYFTERLFLNPRILAILQTYEFNNELHLEQETLLDLKTKLNVSDTHFVDFEGPFKV